MLHTALAFLPSVLFFPWVWFHSLHSESKAYPLYFGWHEFCKLGTERKADGSLYCTHAANSPLLRPDKEKCSKAGMLQCRWGCVVLLYAEFYADWWILPGRAVKSMGGQEIYSGGFLEEDTKHTKCRSPALNKDDKWFSSNTVSWIAVLSIATV